MNTFNLKYHTVQDDIENKETIGYAIFNPDHIGQNGSVSTAAFTTKQLEDCLLSIFRVSYSSTSEISSKIIAPRVERRPNTVFCGILTAICQELRNIFNNNKNIACFIVRSDPLDDFPSHGLIGFNPLFKEAASRSDKTQARAELMRVFGEVIKALEEVFLSNEI